MRTELIDKWVRAFVGDTAVVDTRRPLLFWEDAFPVPNYAYDPADVRTDLLVPSRSEPPSGFDFFEPRGPVSQMYDLVLGDRTLPRAAWQRDDPALADRLVVSWRPGLLDRWLEESEEVGGHPRDPYKRVEALASTRHVVVSLDGVTLADTTRPVLLFETGLPTRFYVPEEDLVAEALEPSGAHSFCPYKGRADRYWSVRGRPDATDIAWSYAQPFPAVGKVAGRVAFYNELVDISVDDVPLQRPDSVFRRREHRPAAD
ncbi:DUF427 domain-containing protein [Microlunatus ginsengisoli]|uniref:DUF427 domain-containing protein n=1 Tax=Microlunatus ginsengisoli TaxID=363863 RepID=A0ABP7AWI6_9ACTN